MPALEKILLKKQQIIMQNLLKIDLVLSLYKKWGYLKVLCFNRNNNTFVDVGF